MICGYVFLLYNFYLMFVVDCVLICWIVISEVGVVIVLVIKIDVRLFVIGFVDWFVSIWFK